MFSSDVDQVFEALLTHLKQNQNCDLMGYKRSILMRRFQRRMESIQIDSYQIYFQYLQQHPEECAFLLDDVLINVTCFFRDRNAWDYLASDTIPQILAGKQSNEPIRVWSAGCSGGQEIYSLLILLAEALGIEACLQRVRCFATDADPEALRQARQGIYSNLETTGIPPDLLKKYFQQTQKGYVFHSALRRTIVFTQHDLTKNAPMSKIDLLMCRNVLMYFNSDAQAAMLVRFHFALRNTGFLFLGKAETVTKHRKTFTPVHVGHHVYFKGAKLSLQDHLSVSCKLRQKQTIELSLPQIEFWKTAFAASPIAQIAIDRDGYIVEVNEQANFLFGLTSDDCSCPFQELELGKKIKSHLSIETFEQNPCAVTLRNIEWSAAENTKYFDAVIAPVFDAEKHFMGVTLAFLAQTDCKPIA